MKYGKITAIVRKETLENVEKKLQEMGAPGVSITKVKGYGEYADLFRSDWLTTHARLEIFTTSEKAGPLAEAIMDAACVGTCGDGIVAILPVERLFRIRDRREVPPDEL